MSRNKRIVLVGEAYGRDEEAYGRCFIGRAGRLLCAALKECGFERYDVHFTNVCMFRPSDEHGGNRPPTDEEVLQQYPRLAADIQHFSTVILLGRTAHNTLSPRMDVPMRDVLGTAVVRGSQRYVSIWHPAYVLRNLRLMPEYVSMLHMALLTGDKHNEML